MSLFLRPSDGHVEYDTIKSPVGWAIFHYFSNAAILFPGNNHTVKIIVCNSVLW